MKDVFICIFIFTFMKLEKNLSKSFPSTGIERLRCIQQKKKWILDVFMPEELVFIILLLLALLLFIYLVHSGWGKTQNKKTT